MTELSSVPSEEEYELLLAKRKAEDEKWGKLITTLKNHSAVFNLYHKPGLRKILVIARPDKVGVIYDGFYKQKFNEMNGEILVLAESPYTDKASIIADGYREVGMQRLILESASFTFLANYPGDLAGYTGVTNKRQTRFITQRGILIPRASEEANRWTEVGEVNNTVLQKSFCAELDTHVEIEIVGDQFNKAISIKIADK